MNNNSKLLYKDVCFPGKKAQRSVTFRFFCLAILSSVFSQIPEIQSYLRPTMFLLWILACGYSFIEYRRPVMIPNFMVGMFFAVALNLVFNLVISLNDDERMNSSYASLMFIPFFMYFMGTRFFSIFSDFQIRNLLWVFCLSSLFLGIYIKFVHIGSSSSWYGSLTYLYTSKNSAAQILVSGAIIAFLFLKSQNKILNLLRITIVFVNIICCLYMMARAAIISLFFAYLFLIFCQKNIKTFFAFFLFGIGLLILYFSNENFEIFINHSFLLDKYSNSDADEFSSGRLSLYYRAFQLFKEAPFCGIGKYYVDNFYISLLTGNGIIGSVFFIFVIFWRFGANIKFYLKEKSIFSLTTLLLTVFFFGESLFEGLPPFGPGVCAMMLWFLSSRVDMQKEGVK